ncbi:Sodium/bile acid cotransporter [Holothuria leucospilota]|uniref:Sodium/bile acid cotransporter n=1 Tax=Holothuria leucospilota TaxID=206669 RepID=A0A9Q1BHJ7_HOLLE|nr:Sodium/bile acid cotransporter [Holothuria leucospilota]
MAVKPGRIFFIVILSIAWTLAFCQDQGSRSDQRLQPERDFHFDISFEAQNNSVLYTEGDLSSINVTIHTFRGPKPVAIFARSSSEAVFTVSISDGIGYVIEPTTDFSPFTFAVDVAAHSIGIETLEIVATEERIEESGVLELVDENSDVVASLTVKVKLTVTLIGLIVEYGVFAVLVFWFCNLGSSLELDEVLERIKKPWGVIVGVVAQFTIMPPLALGLTYLYRLDSATALGLVLIGTCPGGNLSNTLSVILSLDYALSVTMTVCTNILALGMMPLNMFIYTKPIAGDDTNLQVPYLELLFQLAIIIVPFFIGIFLGHKFPKYKEFSIKWLKRLAAVVILILLAVDFPFRLYVFRSDWEIFLSAISLPLIGTIIGGVVAKMVCVETKSALTIGLETGIQNALLAAGILTLSYPAPEGDLAVRTAYLAVIFSTFVGIVAGIINYIYRRLKGESDDDTKDLVDPSHVEVQLDPRNQNGKKDNSEIQNQKDRKPKADGTDRPASSNGIDNPTFDSNLGDGYEVTTE